MALSDERISEALELASDGAIFEEFWNRSDQRIDQLLNRSDLDQLLNLLAHGSADGAYEFIRRRSSDVEPIENRRRRIAHFGKPVELP